MNELTSQDLSKMIVWIRGIPPFDFWVRREEMISELIQKNRLKPTDMSAYQVEDIASAPVARGEKAALKIRRPPFPGGMRVPHLHFRGEVYLLNEQQWRSFSGAVLKDLNTKLANAAHLSFEQLRDVADSIDKSM